jgi:hypothetical protein
MRCLLVVALTVPLAGCFSLTAPKSIPEWAMSPQAENPAEPRAKVTRHNVTRHNVAARPPAVRVVERTGSVSDAPINMQPAGLGRAVVRAKPTALPAPEFSARSSEPTAFSTEWQARENERDGVLLRSMGNICRGC